MRGGDGEGEGEGEERLLKRHNSVVRN